MLEPETSQKTYSKFFWTDKKSWIKASKNTLNCLIGCSIGDFGTIICFQVFWPQINIFLVMFSRHCYNFLEIILQIKYLKIFQIF